MKDGRFESAREMMQALIDGKKVKAHSWRMDQFCVLVDGEKFVDESGSIWEPTFCNFKEYGLYQEPKKLKKVKLLGYIDLTDGAIITRFENIEMKPEYFKRCPSLDREVDVEE